MIDMQVEVDGLSDVEGKIREGYRHFETGDFDAARDVLNEAHSLDFENVEVKSALRACGFWKQRLEGLGNHADSRGRGDYLRRQWNHFDTVYRNGMEHELYEGSTALKRWVLGEALSSYRRAAAESGGREVLVQAARCLKELGRYDEAMATLEEALRERGGSDARLYGELADTYALVGDTKPAKVMMREALYLDAESVDLKEIDAPLFRRLIDRLAEEHDVDALDFACWLPVYGALWGVLDISRELSPVEYGKLKQSIYALKSEIADGDRNGTLTPRLINGYFRLIDHYQAAGADRSLVEDALMNVKLLSPGLYRTYFE